MLKKIVIVSILCISFFSINNTFSEFVWSVKWGWNGITPLINSENVNKTDNQWITESQAKITPNSIATDTTNVNQWPSANEKAITPDSLKNSTKTGDNPTLSAEWEKAKANQKQAEKDAYDNSKASAWDITSRWFTINVGDVSPGMWVPWSTTKENINYLLWTIIQNLMIALWSIALLIMTIWAGFMLLYFGQDEQLSKWKKIFMSWVYSLIVALSAYYIISIVRYLLYFWDN